MIVLLAPGVLRAQDAVRGVQRANQPAGLSVAQTAPQRGIYPSENTDSPAFNPPASNMPAYNPPAINSPAYNPPAINPPIYNPPADNPPAFNPPVFNGPTDRSPAYNPPAAAPAMAPAAATPGSAQGLPAGTVASPTGHTPLRIRDMSWIYIEPPKARKVRVHDIVTVIVSENSESTQNSRFNRQRNAQLQAQLRQFVRINSSGNLDTAANQSPQINGQLRSQLQSFGTAIDQEGLKYRIAATVVDVLPNGTLILEARKSITNNRDLWEYSLTGRIRSEDVLANNTVLSENVADMVIAKRDYGKVRDSTKRGLLMTLYDWLLPF